MMKTIPERGIVDVLIVDDDPAIRQALEVRLAAAYYRVRSVPSGEDALRACSARRPDVVLLDVSMPGMDGYQVCERIRDSIDTPIIVVFLTATTHGGTSSCLEQLVCQSGGDYFLAKPYDPELLVDLLNKIRDEVSPSEPASGQHPS